MKTNKYQAALTLALALSPAIHADGSIRADSHAPIGVMGDHTHSRGEWMFSYRFMSMDMAGNLIGDDSVSPETIATTVPNRFFGNPMQPPTLRVVPTDMRMDMHMLGGMFAPTDSLTLMLMTSYHEKEMDHVTFQGGMGSNRLGTFTTRASGLGDSSLSALYRLHQSSSDTVDTNTHLTFGYSMPTGSITERDDVLTPLNTRPELRLPYPMQLGSGTHDIIAGLTHNRLYDRTGFGAQWRSVIRTGENHENYTLGDVHQLSFWGSVLFSPAVSLSARLDARHTGRIDGIDPQIMAPVQTANPDFQGGDRVNLGLGLNLAATESLSGHRLSLEVLFPVHQDLNGPQMENDWTVTLGYQYSP